MRKADSALTPAVFRYAFPAAGTVFDFRSDPFSTLVSGWNDSRLQAERDATHFGFVGSGPATLSCESGRFELQPGMYFAVPGAAAIEGRGCGFIASRFHYTGLFQIGGPVEKTGRLRYIDGCSDTLLIAPIMLGDPCLNLLHIPPHTDQTAHTHPSLRVGMILDGEGVCRTSGGKVTLTPGLVFAIQAGGLHSFHTSSHSLRIAAWHPDSDVGPTHEQHPMVSRTLVDGQPVNQMSEPR